MLTKERILFILEGNSSERIIAYTLQKCLFSEGTFIECVFDAEIYQLYQKIKDENFAVDIVELLRTRTPENEKILKQYNRDSFAYIYLFFDYDAHSSLADDEKLKKLLTFFDNETEQGKLFINYPMIEALKHFRDMDSFRSLTAKCKGRNCPNLCCEERTMCLKEPHYKTIAAQNNIPCLNNLHYDNKTWKTLIIAHLCKMNDLVVDEFSLPDTIHSQSAVFEKQLEKYVLQECPIVAVLSAFPMFVLDFFGCEKTKEKLIAIDSN